MTHAEIVAHSAVEARYVASHLGGRLKTTVIPHLAGVCVDNEGELPAPEGFPSGYVLLPSRASKGAPEARDIARTLGRPLVGNLNYQTAAWTTAQLNFDRCNPYRGATLVVAVSKNDSYNIAVAKALAYGVPVVWDDRNPQIRELWSEFPSAIALSTFDGQASVARAQKSVEHSKDLIRRRIAESLRRFDRVVNRPHAR